MGCWRVRGYILRIGAAVTRPKGERYMHTPQPPYASGGSPLGGGHLHQRFPHLRDKRREPETRLLTQIEHHIHILNRLTRTAFHEVVYC